MQGKTMKNFQTIITCIVPCILYNTTIMCTATFTFFMEPYPIIDAQQAAQATSAKIKKVGNLTKYLSAQDANQTLISGIFSTYWGYLAASDLNGKTVYPNKNRPPELFYLLVTPQLFPIIMFGNTIDRWQIVPDVPAQLYKIERKKDEELNEFYWQTSKEPLPENMKISKKTITIFARPDKIYIPEGVTPTTSNIQMCLPTIYIKKGLAKMKNALFVLTIRNFFAPIRAQYKLEPLQRTELI